MNIGVVVARFQVDDLHDGHQLLLKAVAEENDQVVVVLGTSQALNTQENPLNFETRKLMVKEVLPDVTVLALPDHPDDDVWSNRLDQLLAGMDIPATGSMILYGGRDSFLDVYSGGYVTCPFGAVHHEPGTEIRNRIGKQPRASADFRAGVIYASQNRYPTVFTTVDVAVWNEAGEILLGRKSGATTWCLIGGFADPASPTFEADAAREVEEETGLGTGKMTYVGSYVVDDWRYRKGPDIIKTLLFSTRGYGEARAADDIAEVRWFTPFAAREVIQECHRVLLFMAARFHTNRRATQ